MQSVLAESVTHAARCLVIEGRTYCEVGTNTRAFGSLLIYLTLFVTWLISGVDWCFEHTHPGRATILWFALPTLVFAIWLIL